MIVLFMMALLTATATVVFDENGMTDAYLGESEINQEDIIRERQYGSETRILAQTTTGELAYVIYDRESGQIKYKMWDDEKTRVVESGQVIPLF